MPWLFSQSSLLGCYSNFPSSLSLLVAVKASSVNDLKGVNLRRGRRWYAVSVSFCLPPVAFVEGRVEEKELESGARL